MAVVLTKLVILYLFNWLHLLVGTINGSLIQVLTHYIVIIRQIVIVRVSVVLRRTVWGDIDWRFDNLSGSHHQSQVNCESSVNRRQFTELWYDSWVQTIYSFRIMVAKLSLKNAWLSKFFFLDPNTLAKIYFPPIVMTFAKIHLY